MLDAGLEQPGDVLVVHVSGHHEYGYWGEIMAKMAKARGVAGLVIDGCVRDGVLLGAIGFPVFARGLCMRGTGKDFDARRTPASVFGSSRHKTGSIYGLCPARSWSAKTNFAGGRAGACVRIGHCRL